MSVGWLSSREATKLVGKTFARPLVLVASSEEQLRVAPRDVGAHAMIEKAVRRAKSARSGAAIPLDVDVSRPTLRRYVERLAKRLDRKPVDAGVVLRGVKPRLIEAEDGRFLKRLRVGLDLRIALARQSA